MACSTSLCFSSTIPSPASCSSGSSRLLSIRQVSSAPSLFRSTIQYKQRGHTLHRRSHMLAFASADAPQGKRSSGENVVMVDPLEAKRLAAKQMQEIRAKEKLKYIGGIHVLRIIDCKNLESVPLSFREMSELRELDIGNCPRLRIVSSDVGNKILPPSLKKLVVKQCGDLELVLIESLHGLANLSELVLENCPGLESLPSADVWKNLKSLKFMEIIGCDNLTSFGGLGSLGSLISLKISGCSKLTELSLSMTAQAPAVATAEGGGGGGGDDDDDSIQEDNVVVPAASSLHVDYLEVDIPSVLNIDPLKSLCHTKGLTIGGGRQMQSLPEQWLFQNHRKLQSLRVQGASSLESLPVGMRDLTALNSLLLSGAEKLRSLVDLPSTLRSLDIMGCCPELETNIREKNSAEWKKITHIPKVHIAAVKIVQSRPHVFHGGYYFMYGKECSEETFYGRQ